MDFRIEGWMLRLALLTVTASTWGSANYQYSRLRYTSPVRQYPVSSLFIVVAPKFQLAASTQYVVFWRRYPTATTGLVVWMGRLNTSERVSTLSEGRGATVHLSQECMGRGGGRIRQRRRGSNTCSRPSVDSSGHDHDTTVERWECDGADTWS